MGDLLRQLLYPLVLPAIVGSVWVSAWAMKLEAGFAASESDAPADVMAFEPGETAPPSDSGYGFSAADGFASVELHDEE